MDDSPIDNGLVKHIVTVHMMLQFGLDLLYSLARIERGKEATNIDRFNLKFGVHQGGE
jgi:hypothetical protein